MRAVVLIWVMAIAAGCGRGGGGGGAVAPAAADVPAVAPHVPPAPPKTQADELRDVIREFVTTLADCDKDFFADVKPERIDRWDLPVNVKAMEASCDRLLSLFDTLLDKGAFRCGALDEFIRSAALASDRYLLLAFRCKKVGVRDKVAYKEEVTTLRDGLRADVARLKESVGLVLGLDDVALRQYSSEPEVLPRAADAALSRLRGDLKQWVEVPLKEGRPTWRYSLRASDAIASRAVAALRFKGVGGGLADPGEALSRAFSAAVAFYTGAYFDAEEKEGPKVRGAVARAEGPWRAAVRKVLRQ